MKEGGRSKMFYEIIGQRVIPKDAGMDTTSISCFFNPQFFKRIAEKKSINFQIREG
jgi:hypothetical protein